MFLCECRRRLQIEKKREETEKQQHKHSEFIGKLMSKTWNNHLNKPVRARIYFIECSVTSFRQLTLLHSTKSNICNAAVLFVIFQIFFSSLLFCSTRRKAKKIVYLFQKSALREIMFDTGEYNARQTIKNEKKKFPVRSKSLVIGFHTHLPYLM